MRRFNINFCKENCIILTAIKIPIYLCFIASLGQKFSYPTDTNDKEIFEYLISYDKIGNDIGDYGSSLLFKKERSKFIQKFFQNNFRNSFCKATKAQEFINQMMKRSRNFLHNNPDIIVLPADKGGRMVVTDLSTYKEKMRAHIQSNVDKKFYYHCKTIDFEYARNFCETKYNELRVVINNYFSNDKNMGFMNLCFPLAFEPFILSRIFGYFKVQKTGIPIRPIISSTNCMGQHLSKWLLVKLNIIAQHLGEFQLKNGMDLSQRIDKYRLNQKHVLVTWDYDNMFTNIPFGTTKKIIREFYYLIEKETSMPVDVFLEAISFLIEGCSYFSYENEIYRQIKGLSMGNSLSQILAEITTSYFLKNASAKFKNGEISLLFKYVDDIFGAIDSEFVNDVQEEISSQQVGLQLKIENENSNREINYLNLTIGRYPEEDNKIYVKFWQKECSCKHILDFHSFHPEKMKRNVTQEFINNALKVSSAEHWKEVIALARQTLRNSNYPNKYINKQINKAQKLLGEVIIYSSIGVTDLDAVELLKFYDPQIDELTTRPSRKYNGKLRTKNKQRKYVAHPYHPPISTFTSRMVKKLNFNDVTLAPRIIKNNRNLIVSNVKDKRAPNCLVNSSFAIRCEDCDFMSTIHTDQYDIERTMKHQLTNPNAEIAKHCKTNQHSVGTVIDKRDVVQHKCKGDVILAKAIF